MILLWQLTVLTVILLVVQLMLVDSLVVLEEMNVDISSALSSSTKDALNASKNCPRPMLLHPPSLVHACTHMHTPDFLLPPDMVGIFLAGRVALTHLDDRNHLPRLTFRSCLIHIPNVANVSKFL